MDGIFLQSVEALGDAQFIAGPGEIWERLQGDKEAVSRDILMRGDLSDLAVASRPEDEATKASPCEIGCRNREILENRLRAINDAQDRLIDGGYGVCLECGEQIDPRRLSVNPAASLCINCQQTSERASSFHSL